MTAADCARGAEAARPARINVSGPRVTAADCVAFPHVRLVVRVAERTPEVLRRLELHPFDGKCPHPARWVARIEAMPGYDKTFPAHWKV